MLRACPCSDERQALLSYRVRALAGGARRDSYLDYFGTRVDLFGVAQPAPRARGRRPRCASRCSGSATRASPPSARGSRLGSGLRRGAPGVPGAERAHRLRREPARARPRERDRRLRRRRARAIGSALAAHVRRSFQYAPGSTHVGIDVERAAARAARRLPGLRALPDRAVPQRRRARALRLGLPVRRADEPGARTPQRRRGTVQTHAWIGDRDPRAPAGGRSIRPTAWWSARAT